MLTMRCSLANASVAQHVKKNKVKVLKKMHSLVEGLPEGLRKELQFSPLGLFTTWLERTIMGSLSILSQCPNYFLFQGVLGHNLDLKKIQKAGSTGPFCSLA
mmetsp:Transcript_35929/g.70707  ORF Transcript_35929/g.70707 Transcript_35929/m.70707 type:complete len:102 (+) Transcript_35929:59-364(+)